MSDRGQQARPFRNAFGVDAKLIATLALKGGELDREVAETGAFRRAAHELQACRLSRQSIDESSAGAPGMASFIFHSLAARYVEVLQQIESHSGRRLRRFFIVGGSSQNALLN